MKSLSFLVALGAGAALATGAANAADLSKLVPELKKECRAPTGGVIRINGSSNFGVIGAKPVRAALLKTYGFDSAMLLDKDPAQLARDAVEAARTGAETGTEGQLAELALLVSEWGGLTDGGAPLLRLEDGGLKISSQTPLTQEELLTRVLSAREDGMQIICRAPQPPPPPPPPPPPQGTPVPPAPPTFSVAKTPDALTQIDITKKSFAEFAFTNDSDKDVQTFGIAAAAGVRFSERRFGNKQTWSFSRRPSLYVSYERKGENDPASTSYVNNLNFGGQISGDLQLKGSRTWIGYYVVSGQFETDDDFASRAYGVELRVDPPLLLPGNREYLSLPAPTGVRAEAIWNVDLVAKWSEVQDPGEKAALTTRPEFLTLGYDLGLQMLFGPDEDGAWRLIWSTTYQLRDGRTEDGGDAQMFTSSVALGLAKDTRYSVGVTYERGENLQSFAPSEVWKLVLGYRY